MKILWAPEAIQDRTHIWDYLYTLNPRAAREMDERFSECVEHLVHNPLLGNIGLIEGTRELIPHPSYRLVYQVAQDSIQILALLHTARQWPPLPSI
ncbi:type II toxin-antitoxin system RelE/ParE family toxin [Pseudomonas sp. NFXW11]